MRFKLKKLEPRKKEFEIFIKDGFLFLPKKFNNEIRWLEKVKKVYQYERYRLNFIGYLVEDIVIDPNNETSFFYVIEEYSSKLLGMSLNLLLKSVSLEDKSIYKKFKMNLPKSLTRDII